MADVFASPPTLDPLHHSGMGHSWKTSPKKWEISATRTPGGVAEELPLRQDLVLIPRVPRLSIWCGTTLKDDWHKRFNAAVVISGHLHEFICHVRIGGMGEWDEVKDEGMDVNDISRVIWPGPQRPEKEPVTTQWRSWG
ncbi:hypothetical protein FB45DRAFT_1035388 [Roridomyces roridus]|uniref:Uncharacterized protein n=1 Tax=Roridomyces roridus TaxID=1738132 RepID=A0AAD7BAM4_9AGAR|nr:hypothetical protein FB45DRAFT_1035388 [Roridomyces roridus]